MGDDSQERKDNIHDLSEFLEIIEEDAPQEGETNFYRGHSDKTYILKPSVWRGVEFETNEKEILEEFCSYFHEKTRDKTAFEKLMLARHYDLPTRLLDVTLNPLVALWFACYDDKDYKNDDKCYDKDRKDDDRLGYVYHFLIDIDKERILAPSSDRLYFISELAFLKNDDRQNIKKLIENYKKPTLRGENIKDIKKQKSYYRWFKKLERDAPGFSEAIIAEDLRKYFFIKPIYSNPRIRAQSGGFIIAGQEESFDDLDNNKDHAAKNFIIPADCKEAILFELDAMNINEMTLFPDMDHTAKYLKRKYLGQS